MKAETKGRRRLATIARRGALVAAALLACAAAAAAVVVRRHLPDDDAPLIEGIAEPTRVDLDARGIPTVHAATLLDALRVQGYVTARERLFQMEMQRRVADGTMAEILGPAALPLDRVHRVYGFRRVAEAAVDLLPSDERAQLEAYAAGVNAFIQSHPGRWGLEFQLLDLAPRPWTSADSIRVLLLLYEQLSSSWSDELTSEALERLPVEERRFLMPRVTPDDVVVFPDADPKPAPDAELFFQSPHAALAPAPLPLPPDPFGLPGDAGKRAPSAGSNSWVVAGTRTKSGKPLLANDPHLGLSVPGTWCAIRFTLGDQTIEGVSIPGIPAIIIGRNDRVAWGFTNLGTDIQDLFREPPEGERVEEIAAKGAPPETLRVPVGRHGPQVREGYSLAWVALDPRNLRVPMASIMTATTWTSFNEAFDRYLGPAQNVVYADIDGHIGWRASGLVPLRHKGDEGAVPRDGTDPANDWRGFIPMSEMPRVLDPRDGYIVTANQRTVGTSFPHPMATEWGNPYRARRIAERIEGGGKLDRRDMEAIQLDVVSLYHRAMMEALAAQVSGLERFRGWDGAARAGDSLFLEAWGWSIALRRTLNAKLLASGQAEFDWNNEEATFLAMLRADPAAWARAGLGDKSEFLREAQARVAAWMPEQRASTWGERNALGVKHLFGNAGPIASWIFDPPGFPQSGAPGAPRVTQPQFGQSMRFIVDWAEPEAATLVLPLGQSGHLGSPHREDQQAAWRDGDPSGQKTRLASPPVSAPLTFAPATGAIAR